jgi:hypothetical protein
MLKHGFCVEDEVGKVLLGGGCDESDEETWMFVGLPR